MDDAIIIAIIAAIVAPPLTVGIPLAVLQWRQIAALDRRLSGEIKTVKEDLSDEIKTVKEDLSDEIKAVENRLNPPELMKLKRDSPTESTPLTTTLSISSEK